MSYPRLRDRFATPIKGKATKKDIGKTMTIPNQAMSLKDIIQRSISGFPVPMQREEIFLHPDINQMLEGTKYDIVSDAKFRNMSKTERQRYINNIKGLRQGLQQEMDKAIQAKEAADAAINSNEAAAAAAAANEANTTS